MKVLVTAISFSPKISGIQRHAFNLVRCLLAHPEVSAVHLVIAPWQQAMVKSAGLGHDIRLHIEVAQLEAGSISRNLWHYRALPELANRLQPDLIHLTYPVPINAVALRCAVVLTLHDLYPYDIPENFGFPKVWVSRAILRQCLRNVDAIACVSNFTLSRLQDLNKQLARKASVVPNSVERDPRPEDMAAPVECAGHPFVLCVAQHRRNKNISLALRAFHALLRSGERPLSTRFLLVGNQGPETSAIRGLAASLGITKNIVELTGISDAQLQWCYRNCLLLVAPSAIEGFGLPVAEALLAGCPVVCSDIPAFREVGNSNCLYFSLGARQVDLLTDAMSKALRMPVPKATSLPKFSTQVIGHQYLNLYRAQFPTEQIDVGITHVPYEISTERPFPL